VGSGSAVFTGFSPITLTPKASSACGITNIVSCVDMINPPIAACAIGAIAKGGQLTYCAK
jgi:hypothetical protein